MGLAKFLPNVLRKLRWSSLYPVLLYCIFDLSDNTLTTMPMLLYSIDVADPRGGVRWVIPEKARYW
jgi:hypothetical protein